jgi:large subunit ribosomal protein L22
MLITATQKYTRQTPRKVRLIANTVKKLPLSKAMEQLAIIERKATLVVSKVVKQAVANAMNNHGYKFEDLELESILVTDGPRYRRFRSVSRGRAHGIIKRVSHVTVTLRTTDELKPAEVKTKSEETEMKAEEAKKVETKTETKKAAPKKAAPKKEAK